MRFGVMRSVTKVPVIRHLVAVILGGLAWVEGLPKKWSTTARISDNHRATRDVV